MWGIAAIIASVASSIEAIKQREEYLNSIPKEEADKIRKNDSYEAAENKRHRRAIEVAEAGRARNFWGN